MSHLESECKVSITRSEFSSARASDPRQCGRWLNTKRETLLAVSQPWSPGFMTLRLRADRRSLYGRKTHAVCALDSTPASESIVVSSGPSLFLPLVCAKACRGKKSSRLRVECNFSGIVNRYLYHSTPTRRRTILERSAYQLAWKLGLTLSHTHCLSWRASWPRPYLFFAASTLYTTRPRSERSLRTRAKGELWKRSGSIARVPLIQLYRDHYASNVGACICAWNRRVRRDNSSGAIASRRGNSLITL